jgi:hypothetical protein
MKLVRSVLPAALGGSGHSPLLVAVAFGGLVLVIAGIGGVSGCGAGSSADRPDPGKDAIVSDTSTPTPVLPTPSAELPRPQGPSITVGSDATPTGDRATPDNGIVAGRWTFPWKVLDNPCDLQLPADSAYTFQEAQVTDGYISHGENVHIFSHNADGTITDIGELPYPFTYPTFDFTWNYSQDVIVRNTAAFGGPDSPYAWQGETHRIWQDGSYVDCQVERVSPNHPDHQ